MRNPFLFLMVSFVVSTLAASAQIQQPGKTWSQLKPFRKAGAVELPVRPAADSTVPGLGLRNSSINNKWYRNGVLIDSVRMGKVYRMPFDNMLCLVPDETNTRMPVKRARGADKMPNAYRRPEMNR